MTKLTKAYHALFEQGISPAEYERRYQAYLSLYFRLRERSANSFLGRISFEQRYKLHPPDELRECRQECCHGFAAQGYCKSTQQS